MAKEGKKPTGRPSLWGKFQVHLEEAQEMRSEGATIKQIATRFEVDPATLYRWRRENKEFQTAMHLAHKNREEGLVGKLWELACGAKRVETVTTTNPKGEETRQVRVLQLEPSLPALLAYLRRFHGWQGEAEPSPVEVEERQKTEEEKREAGKELWRKMVSRLGLAPETPPASLPNGEKNPASFKFAEKNGARWARGTYKGQTVWEGQTEEEAAAAQAVAAAGFDPSSVDLSKIIEAQKRALAGLRLGAEARLEAQDPFAII